MSRSTQRPPSAVCAAPRAQSAQVLGGDQVLVRREAHVADVDAAEQAVPVAVVRLALVEVVEGAARAPARSGMPATLRRDVRSICLWRSLISRYFTWKLRQNAPRSQRASGRPSASARCSSSAKARLSSAGSAHSPISA